MVDDDLRVRGLRTAARREALGELAPRRDELLATATALGLALTATVGVVDRVHRHTTDRRANAEPAGAAGFAERLLVVIAVADFTDGGAAFRVHRAELAGRHLQRGFLAFDGDELEARAGRAGDRRTTAGDELDAVEARGRRDDRQREVVADVEIVGRRHL